MLHGDCLDKLKELPANSVDAIVTDPPYGLSFMGKKWDYDVPSEEIWKEALRVLKPGGHVLSFCGTRTYHRMVVRIEDAGFEIRDQIQWIYGSGFPKSHNIKEGEFKGWGTALKPANEPICLARKPLEGTVARNVLKYGTGAINVDAGRIPLEATANLTSKQRQSVSGEGLIYNKPGAGIVGKELSTYKPEGRWPANVLFDEEAARLLDEQSGTLKTGGNGKSKKAGFQTSIVGGKGAFDNSQSDSLAHSFAGDSGGASRFFYVAKASKRERNEGLEGMPKVTSRQGMGGTMPTDDDGKDRDRFSVTQANHHPTVKPIKLMEYLIKLITPPNGTVLDPFMGSGSTGVAAKRLGFNFIGIEREKEYCDIAEKRISAGEPTQMEMAEA